MLFKPCIIVILMYFKYSLETENSSDIINLISDFVEKQNSPTKITAFSCWTKDIHLKLWRKLSEKYYQSQIRSVQSVLHHPSIEEHQLFLLNVDCNGSKNILNQAQTLNLFNQPFRWLIWGTNPDTIFDNIYLGVDSKVYVIERKDLQYKIKSIYKCDKNARKFMENSVAIWKNPQGFLYFSKVSVTKNRTNLMGTNLAISYVVTNPDTLNHLSDYRFAHIDSMSKLNWIIVYHLLDIVNATSTKTFRDTWGYKNATTSLFSGLIGDLQLGNAEFGGTAFFFTIDRIDIVDYIATTAPTFMRFIFKAPPLSYVTNIFTLPFHTYVWYCSFGLIATILVATYIIVVWEWRDPVFKNKTSSIRALRPNILDVLLMDIGAVTQQGTEAEPRSNAGRIATIFTFIALMFMYTSYSANIVALLQSTTESIKTLEDLLDSRISLGVEDIIYAHYYFENAEEPIQKAIYEQKIAPKGQKPNFIPAVEGIQRVQQDFFAFHIELSTAYKIINDLFQESEKCSLKEVEYVNLLEPWMAIKKNSSYKEIFKVGLKKIYESGLQRREINKIYTKKPTCHSKGSNFGSVGLIDCYAAFVIFGIGISCSIILMLLEKMLKMYKEKNSRLHIDVKVNEEFGIYSTET